MCTVLTVSSGNGGSGEEVMVIDDGDDLSLSLPGYLFQKSGGEHLATLETHYAMTFGLSTHTLEKSALFPTCFHKYNMKTCL